MCRLKIKIKLVGSKHHKVKQIILLPRNFFIKSKFNKKIGFIDARNNKQTRYVIINLYLIMKNYKYGLTPNKSTLNILYYYFIKKNFKNLNSYYSLINTNYF